MILPPAAGAAGIVVLRNVCGSAARISLPFGTMTGGVTVIVAAACHAAVGGRNGCWYLQQLAVTTPVFASTVATVGFVLIQVTVRPTTVCPRESLSVAVACEPADGAMLLLLRATVMVFTAEGVTTCALHDDRRRSPAGWKSTLTLPRTTYGTSSLGRHRAICRHGCNRAVRARPDRASTTQPSASGIVDVACQLHGATDARAPARASA